MVCYFGTSVCNYMCLLCIGGSVGCVRHVGHLVTIFRGKLGIFRDKWLKSRAALGLLFRKE